MTSSSPGSSAVLERQRTTQRYPQARVIVLDDDVNTFKHVVDCLRKIIPGMSEDKACLLYTSPSPRDGRISRMPSSA